MCCELDPDLAFHANAVQRHLPTSFFYLLSCFIFFFDFLDEAKVRSLTFLFDTTADGSLRI